jgi:hypothetical protein
VYDINGREAEEAQPLLDALPNLEQYIYCSSAGAWTWAGVALRWRWSCRWH